MEHLGEGEWSLKLQFKVSNSDKLQLRSLSQQYRTEKTLNTDASNMWSSLVIIGVRWAVWAVCVFFFVFIYLYKHACASTDMCGSLLGVIHNIHHPFCQRQRENSLVSKSLLSWKWRRKRWTAEAHLPWGCSLVTCSGALWPDGYTMGLMLNTSTTTLIQLWSSRAT